MTAPPGCEVIPADALVARVRRLHDRRARLVQIGATRLANRLEVNYSFDLEGQLQHLRLHLPPTGARVPSIRAVYWCAFIYENELHDLFQLEVEGMAVDFHGRFYQTAVKFPFGRRRPPAAAAPGPAPAPLPAAPTPAA
jgi:ech hydrogenase subunit D